MNLFQQGKFNLHSGGNTWFKIDCDALTKGDWKTLAKLVAQNATFKEVVGVSTGGLKFAKALKKYRKRGKAQVATLIVDDVLTTGESMEQVRQTIGMGKVRGIVVFSRGICPHWIVPIFNLQLEVKE